MDYYIDSADLNVIKEYASLSLFAGVTTTPTFFCRHKVTDSEAYVSEIADAFDGCIHIEAMGSSCDEIVKHARRNHKICNRIVSKIPINKEGLKAVRILKQDGIRTNVHLIFSVNQAVLAAEAGADFICPLIGRLNDVDSNGLQMIKNIVSVIKAYGYPIKIMASSIRGSEDVTESLLCGVDAITIPPKVVELLFSHPLTDVGIRQFYYDMALNGSVQEVMRQGSDMPILKESYSLLHTLAEMTEKKIGLGIIVDSNDILSGVVTDGDIRRFLQNAEYDSEELICNIMNRSPITARPNTQLCYALEKMEEKRITEMVIVDMNERPIGYLSIHDILQLKQQISHPQDTLQSVRNTRNNGISVIGGANRDVIPMNML